MIMKNLLVELFRNNHLLTVNDALIDV